MDPSVSIILSSYNQPNSLELALEGVRRQSIAFDELVIADDGSEADTRELVDDYAANVTFPVFFETQEDRGFRKARAQNNAIRRSSGELLLFLDGDCVPDTAWAARHVAALQAGRDFAVGGYVYLSDQQSRALSRDTIADGRMRVLCTPSHQRFFRSMHRKESLYILLGKKRKPALKGGNWAATRKAVYAVNGFDERFDGVGKEDSDMRNRLRNAGFKARSLWNSNWVYHCAHELDPRRTLANVMRGQPDREYYASRRHARWCENGLESP